MNIIRPLSLFLLFSLTTVVKTNAQTFAGCDSVYTFAENPPQYEGGMKGFYDFLKGFTYDEIGPEDPIVGKFTVHLVVDQQGKPVDIQVTPESDPGLALQKYLVKMKDWTPASTKDTKVCYRMKIPCYVHYK